MEGQTKKRLRIILRSGAHGESDPTKRVRREGEGSTSGDAPPLPSPPLPLPTPPPLPQPLPLPTSPYGSYGVVSLIGGRRKMEDCVAVAPRFFRDYDFFAVYDGHGGIHVAELCRGRIHVVLAEEMAEEARHFPSGGAGGEVGMWKRAMMTSFTRVDAEVAAGAAGPRVGLVGTTAIVAAVGAKWIVVGNCGDSRAVLSRGGVAVPLSNDHKPDRPDETARVEAAGGQVFEWNGYRVFGVLATSRAFGRSAGDLYLKPYVTADPETTVISRNERDEFLILASDGLWDVVTNETACRVVRQCLNGTASKRLPKLVNGRTANEAAAVLGKLALTRGSFDNISIVVVELQNIAGNNA
ncbi:protein phosphatase 2C 51-like isoform X1 [Typha angustifolia]|uniref:protein phosphatase 2C 51-like isoform X1 n=1 Tax=Typha angustifolia TaxID=59011 RepID=UPI003C3008B5